MIVLGIDTSCDDTSAGIVVDGKQTLANVIHSQVAVHNPHGGVVPELASREHVRNILPVVDEALKQAGLSMGDLDGIAVTVGPGLVGALLVGLYYAKGLSYVLGKPLIAVNHLEAHILSIFLESEHPSFPFVALTVSGGHTSLYYVEDFGRYTLLGQTLDDAAGEAFDKVAKICGMGYPGGVAIEKASKTGRQDGVKFPRAYMSKTSLDFSFSGLKTAVSLFLNKWRDDPGLKAEIRLDDIVASFQEAVVDVLVNKVMVAAKRMGVTSVVLAGGVACNNHLRKSLVEAGTPESIRVYYPRPAYCTDNGAMIALTGTHRFMRNDVTHMAVDVRARYPIQDLMSE
ncbi:MAG: tRNA (adenosine(37)-N6)-threonylcarbamoyltransferase complex transferase subunit TsaD [Desulfobacteraceae bacterium 4572_87]|nr:MAG: tRNA (adenosine(37)-N6)-threonylcarbamoyltransferase complex transferase subunit TsaD [Desulfobacteraceae bacterium 4572_87]